MTVETETSRVSYTGAGTTGPFTIPFYFLANADIVAKKVLIADGAETDLVLTTDYTLTGAGEAAGGTLTLVSSLTSSYRIVIYRDPELLQETAYPRNDPFPAATHEEVADRQMMISQRTRNLVERSIRVPEGDTGGLSVELPPAVERANKFAGFDANGNVIALAGTVIFNEADAENVGFLQAGSGTVARSVQSKERDIVSIHDFAGADYDAKFTAAMANGAQDIFVPAGTYAKVLPVYQFSGTTAKRVRGAGREKTIIEYEPAAYAVTNFAWWVGDHVNDVVLAAYGEWCPEIHDLSIRVGEHAAGCLRTREVLGGKFSNLLLGALDPAIHVGRTPPGTAANYFWGLMCESNLNTTYDDIDIQPGNGHQDGTILTTALDVHQSRKLDPNAGNTSVSTTTTTRFNNCYLHYAADLMISTGAMTVSLNRCVLEAGARGVTIGTSSWPVTFNDCHFEAISTYPLTLQAGASAIVDGGYYGPAGIGSGLVAGDTFATATDCGVLTISKLSVGGIPQSSLVASSGSGKITMDAVTLSPTNTPTGPIEPAAATVTTVNGSAEITVHHAAHGLAVGAVVGLANFGTVGVAYRGLSINQPFYRVTEIVGVNDYKCKSIWFPTTLATSSGTQASTGNEDIYVYPSNCWLNCVIQEPDYVTLQDCHTETVVFNQAFGGAAGATAIYCGGITTGQKGYTVDDWSYVMTVQGFSSANPGGAQTAGVTISMPNGYETGILLGAPPTSYAVNAQGEYQTALQQIGLKVPPGSSIGYKSDALGATNLQGRIVIARTGMR